MENILKLIPKVKEYLKTHKNKVLVICGLILFFLVFIFSISPPFNSKKDQNIDIPNGRSLMEISVILKEDNIIRSENLFRVAVILLGGEGSIKAGPYLFDGNDNLFRVAVRLIKADYGVPVKKITIIEGMRSRDILDLFGDEFKNLDKALLENELISREGYLFPDTYFFPLSYTSNDIVKMLSNNFQNRIKNIDLTKSKTSKDLNEIIIMASIIEGEAREDNDRRMVADILWRRIEIEMPLQVDTVFMYIMDKPSSEITKADLKIDSPYNTYVNKGLPPGPINNPGLEAINSVMFPTSNEYLYYLSDKDDVMHYAVTFEEHKRNKEKYLR